MRNFYALSLLSYSYLAANQTPVIIDSFSISSVTGASSMSGTTITISNGSVLNFQDQSTAGDAFISIDGTSNLNFQQTGASTYSGLLTGTGTITKSGSGDLTMTGNNTPFTGPLFIQNGTLFLNGSYGGNVSASGSAKIVYGGPIAGNLVVDNSTITTDVVHTLLVGGSYTQTSTGIYQVIVNSAGQSSLISMGGPATISGFIEVDTSAGVLFHHTYTILQAAGGVSGTYGFLGPNPFNFFITYDLNNVYLSVGNPNFAIFAETPNQKHVAAQLDSITTLTPDDSEVLSALSMLAPSKIPHALDLMSGEQFSDLILTSLDGNNRFITTIFNAYRELINPCKMPCVGVTSWLSGGWGRGFQKGSAATPGFHLSNYDISTGIHSCVGEEWVVGGAAAYEADFVHSALPGRVTMQTGQLAFYSAYQTKRVYVLMDLIGAKSWVDSHRKIDFSTIDRTAKSRPQLESGRLDVQVGGNLGGCDFRFQPYIAVSTEGFHQNKIDEHGAGSINLTIQPITKWLAGSQLGFHFNVDQLEETTIDIDLAWKHYYGNLRVTQKSHFKGFGSTFSIEGPKRGHDGLVGALYLSKQLAKAWDIYGAASGELWKDWHGYEFSGGISYKW